MLVEKQLRNWERCEELVKNKCERQSQFSDGNAFRRDFYKSKKRPDIMHVGSDNIDSLSDIEVQQRFVSALIYDNPVWDLGIQRMYLDKKRGTKALSL